MTRIVDSGLSEQPGAPELGNVVRGPSSAGRVVALVLVVLFGLAVIRSVSGSTRPPGEAEPAPRGSSLAPPDRLEITPVAAASARGVWVDRIGWSTLDGHAWRGLLAAACAGPVDEEWYRRRIANEHGLHRAVPERTVDALLYAALRVGCSPVADVELIDEPALRSLPVFTTRTASLLAPGDFVLDRVAVADDLGYLVSEIDRSERGLARPVAVLEPRRPSEAAPRTDAERDLPTVTLTSSRPPRAELGLDLVADPTNDLLVCPLQRVEPCSRVRHGLAGEASADRPGPAVRFTVDSMARWWVAEVGWTARTELEWWTLAGDVCVTELSEAATREVIAADRTIAFGTTTDRAVRTLWEMARNGCRPRTPGPKPDGGEEPHAWTFRGPLGAGATIFVDAETARGGSLRIHHRRWGTSVTDPMAILADLDIDGRSGSGRLPRRLPPGHYRICPVEPADVACDHRLILAGDLSARPLTDAGDLALVNGTLLRVDPADGSPAGVYSVASGGRLAAVGVGQEDAFASLTPSTVAVALVDPDGDLRIGAFDATGPSMRWLSEPIAAPADQVGVAVIDGAVVVTAVTAGTTDVVARLDPTTGLELLPGPVED